MSKCSVPPTPIIMNLESKASSVPIEVPDSEYNIKTEKTAGISREFLKKPALWVDGIIVLDEEGKRRDCE